MLVNDRDLYICIVQLSKHTDAAESSTQNYYVRLISHNFRFLSVRKTTDRERISPSFFRIPQDPNEVPSAFAGKSESLQREINTIPRCQHHFSESQTSYST